MVLHGTTGTRVILIYRQTDVYILFIRTPNRRKYSSGLYVIRATANPRMLVLSVPNWKICQRYPGNVVLIRAMPKERRSRVVAP